MELLTDKLNAILASVGTQSTDEERAAVSDRLRFLIIAYGKAQSVAAIQLEHKVFESLGLVAVDKDALTTLNENMASLVSSSADALADADVDWLKTGLPSQQHYLSSRHDATIDHEGRTFRIKDPDLQALMDDTESLLSPGGANMDVGLSWADSLAVVLKRLHAEKAASTQVLNWPHAPGRDGAQDAPPKPDDDFDDDDEVGGAEAALQLWLRYRVTLVMSKTLGRVIALHFKTDKVKLVEILGCHDTDSAEVLFNAFETEFNCRISDSDRGAMIEMTNIEIAQYFGERIKDAKAK